MSYTVTVVVPPVPDSAPEAWECVESLGKLRGVRPPVFQELHDRLVARFPCLSSLPDDEVDDAVWTDGPLIDNFGHRIAVLGIASDVEDVLQFVVKTATDLGLVVLDPQAGRISRPGSSAIDGVAATSQTRLKKADVARLMREELEPTMKELGFRWARGMFVRKWDGGSDRFGWGHATYGPVHHVGGFALLRIDVVEELVTPHIPFSPPEAAKDAWSLNVNWLTAFEDGPETSRREDESVETEDQVRSRAHRFATLVRERIDPFWRSIRTPGELWRMPHPWRRFIPDPKHMHYVALAFLCAPASEQTRVEMEALAAFPPTDMHGKWIRSLIDNIRERRSNGH